MWKSLPAGSRQSLPKDCRGWRYSDHAACKRTCQPRNAEMLGPCFLTYWFTPGCSFLQTKFLQQFSRTSCSLEASTALVKKLRVKPTTVSAASTKVTIHEWRGSTYLPRLCCGLVSPLRCSRMAEATLVDDGTSPGLKSGICQDGNVKAKSFIEPIV